ncbi:L-serine ammonia-lyase, iron-sulfur-dependent, subunit alpha [Bacillus cytotoxicus]|nr:MULTISPECIES: L-serine ammonia-lyase, iron-sulfur-dependent, subunit alpha [Bacillus cereus group]MDH2862262.1 L-serine ammonia-lyase, iron-sulfur-dependent, subunit alpha [Bacillus cytotoxicus]MDH2865613.1 L-serine ammonia-lyase, iron-sulfur-dependent, subunit alpha [Bacillus cytotoxicus]MDH2869223.1 L-serine ammonia-lyase, iron-sulfur-dependent, subunit alpha [Bacillus cytotoxicus]MDH2874318.1 L-serine ammonia-lyase, iron-sulfur-dependent, subunit alpha [Bacillus cytotoxicus]MDH2877656.1 
MANSGSGNQGIAATLPVVAVAEKLDIDEETMLRAVALSHLITNCNIRRLHEYFFSILVQ